MPAIERTAYPRLRQRYFRQQDLQLYRPSQEEISWMKQHVTGDLRLQRVQPGYVRRIAPLRDFRAYFV